MTPRRFFVFAARFVVVIVIYFVIGRSLHLPQLTTELSSSLVYGLASAVFLTLLQAAICTLRWMAIARPVIVVPKFRYSYLAYVEGMFINQALPSIAGGDALRVVRWRENGVSLSDAAISVFFDRIFGLFGAAALGMISVTLLWNLGYEQYWLILGALASISVLAGCFGVLALAAWQRLPKLLRLSGQAAEFAAEAFKFKLDRRDFALCILYSLAGQLLAGSGVLAISRGLGIEVSEMILITATALITLISMIPISLGGWGVREAGFLALLLPLGVSPENAVLLGILFGIQGLLASLIGGVSLLFGLALSDEKEKWLRETGHPDK